jgi:hypothetical protein
MSLAHAFGPQAAKASALRQLVPGAIVKIFEKMDDGIEREKWYVVVQVTESTVTCVINTNIPKLIQHRPALLKCQVDVLRNAQPFMTHDSHLDCSKVRIYPTEKVVGQLAQKPEWIGGTASDEVLTAMIEALGSTPLLTAEEATSYCTSIKTAISVNAAQGTAAPPAPEKK